MPKSPVDPLLLPAARLGRALARLVGETDQLEGEQGESAAFFGLEPATSSDNSTFSTAERIGIRL
jgi:hypothetical protein